MCVKMIQWLLLVIVVYVQYVGSSGEELFCKDPDTDEYHAANSTWKSTSFCGNYTCKIRPKNLTATEYIPLAIDKEMRARKIIADLKDAFYNNDETKNSEGCSNCNEISEDRFLNTEEVNSLTKFLYSVKKSDLDTLIEMYNIASELYGEMDTSATEDTPGAIVRAPVQISQQYLSNSLPYWYPYWQYFNQFTRMGYSYPQVYSTYTQQQPIVQTGKTSELLKQSPKIADEKNSDSGEKEMKTDASEIYSNHYSFYPALSKANNNEEANSNPGILYTNPSNALSSTSQYPQYVVAVPSSYSPQNYYNYTYPHGPYYYMQHPSLNHNPYYSKMEANSEINTPRMVPNIAATVNSPCKIHNEVPKYTCPWKTPPLSQNALESVRAHIVPRTATNTLPKPKILHGLLNPFKRMRLEKVGKVRQVRLGDIRRGKRDTDTDDDVEEARKHIAEEIKNIEKEIEDLKEKKNHEKKQENETMVAYISTVSCEFETEPGFFRAGDNKLPFPLCCPQRIEDKQ